MHVCPFLFTEEISQDHVHIPDVPDTLDVDPDPHAPGDGDKGEISGVRNVELDARRTIKGRFPGCTDLYRKRARLCMNVFRKHDAQGGAGRNAAGAVRGSYETTALFPFSRGKSAMQSAARPLR